MARATLFLGATILYYDQSSKSMGMLLEGIKPVWLVGY
jgi:hypothetical protein